MTEIMPVPRNLILLSYQQRAFPAFFIFAILNLYEHFPYCIIYILSVKRPIFGLAGRRDAYAAQTRGFSVCT